MLQLYRAALRQTFRADHRKGTRTQLPWEGAHHQEDNEKKKKLNALAEISQLACATPFSEPEAERPPDANVLTDTRPVPSQVIMLSMQTTFAGMASAFNAPVVPARMATRVAPVQMAFVDSLCAAALRGPLPCLFEPVLGPGRPRNSAEARLDAQVTLASACLPQRGHWRGDRRRDLGPARHLELGV